MLLNANKNTYMNKSYILQKIKQSDSNYQECVGLCTISKQLYNVGLYNLRQSLFNDGELLGKKDNYKLMKANENWSNMPAKKVCNQVFMQVQTSWSTYWKAVKSYQKNKGAFTGKPKIPNYISDLNLVTYEAGALGRKGLDSGFIRLSKTNIILDTNKVDGTIKQVRIVPKKNHFLIIGVYESQIEPVKLDFNNLAGLDIGVNNICSIATNQANVNSILVNGRRIKGINQQYNKYSSKFKSKLPTKQYSSTKLRNMSESRNNRIKHEMHIISRNIVDWLVANNIGTLVIGHNKGWKTGVRMWKKTKQHFIQIPFNQLISYLKYKFEEIGGVVIEAEESYTSKASAFDLDELPTYKKGKKNDIVFSGKRIKRGLYKSKSGILVNADINGALNIIRKVARKSLDNLVKDKQFIQSCITPVYLG